MKAMLKQGILENNLQEIEGEMNKKAKDRVKEGSICMIDFNTFHLDLSFPFKSQSVCERQEVPFLF